MKYEEVKKWENTTVEKRGNEYIAFKNHKTNMVLDVVKIKFPNFNDAINTIYSSTPLTYRDYTGVPEGSMYGINIDCNNALSSFISTATKVKNLFLTGQNIGVHGILGVTMNALLTCSNIIDINTLFNDIKKTDSQPTLGKL